MKIPLTYTIKSLLTRKLTAYLTILGIALVVFVFAAVLMMAYGVEKTMVSTGYDDNVLFLRKGADNELTSGIDRDLANMIKTLPQIAIGNDSKPITTSEVMTIINLSKFGTQDMGNVSVRGVSNEAFMMRPDIKIISGRKFTMGAREIIVGKNISKRFEGAQPGKTIKFSGDLWTIVGEFEANGTGFESEIWGEADQLMQALNRLGAYSSMTVKLRDKNDFESLQKELAGDNRLQTVKIEREKEYYARQSRFMAIFIRVLGLVITIGFSAGAIVGAMITMYAAVANRTVEIGTLRALGFRRRNILVTFLLESILLSMIGGALGLVIASGLQFFTISTVNFGTFSELAFSFAVSPEIIVYSSIFAVAIGIVGGFLPSVRAARLNIVNA
ncbi:MAG: ABC transporter permease, partial [Ignavibacteriales bacterium]|nr:ABC transporter permease [Ignavibacteriales bacterium]